MKQKINNFFFIDTNVHEFELRRVNELLNI